MKTNTDCETYVTHLEAKAREALELLKGGNLEAAAEKLKWAGVWQRLAERTLAYRIEEAARHKAELARWSTAD